MERNTFSIVACDGVKYDYWMTNAGLKETSLPQFFLIHFVSEEKEVDSQDTGLKYAARGPTSMETLETDLYNILNEFTLGLLPPLRAEEEESEL